MGIVILVVIFLLPSDTVGFFLAGLRMAGQPREASVVRVAVGLALSAGVAHAGGDPVDGQKQRIVQSLIFLAPAQASEDLHLH